MHIDWHNHDRLLVMLFLAGVFHALLILGVSFDLPRPENVQKSLDIVLVKNPAAMVPKKADFLAPENQLGSGETKEKAAPKAVPLPLRSVDEESPRPSPEHKPKPVAKLMAKPVLRQPRSEKKAVVEETGEKDRVEAEPPHPRLTAEALSQQIAEISSVINQSQQNRARQQKMVYINSVNAHRYKAAAYETAWQEKVERIGNLNYPDEARRKNLSGSLILAVGVNSDGSLYSVKVRQSSGEPVLDQAAQRIVQMAAPFAPFPEELKQEADVLVITRTWRFSVDNRVETAR